MILDALLCMRREVLGYVGPELDQTMSSLTPYLGGDEALDRYPKGEVELANGLGSVSAVGRRAEIYDAFKRQGFRFATIIHPSAVIAKEVRLDEGCQVMAGAVLQPGVRCGENVIINTRSGVDHDCMIGAHAHISIGATLSGSVKVGEYTHIGAGSTVIQGIVIGYRCLVAAGAVVIRDVADEVTVAGVPARKLMR